MRRLLNVLIVIFSIFSLPLIFLFAEIQEIPWLRVVVAMLLIPYMFWWGLYGYNYFFEKTRGLNDDSEDDYEDDDDYDDYDDYDY